MFYCDSCRERNGWPESIFKSFGMCEMCRTRNDCNNVPSRHLPRGKNPPVEEKR